MSMQNLAVLGNSESIKGAGAVRPRLSSLLVEVGSLASIYLHLGSGTGHDAALLSRRHPYLHQPSPDTYPCRRTPLSSRTRRGSNCQSHHQKGGYREHQDDALHALFPFLTTPTQRFMAQAISGRMCICGGWAHCVYALAGAKQASGPFLFPRAVCYWRRHQLKLEAEERRSPSMATIGRIIGAIILIAVFVAIVIFLADQGF